MSDLLLAAAGFNPGDHNVSIVLSNSNLTGSVVGVPGTTYVTARATPGIISGKYCFEATFNSFSNAAHYGIGVANNILGLTEFVGIASGSSVGFYANGSVQPYSPGAGVAITAGTTVLVAVDGDHGKIWVYNPNTSQWNSDIIGNQNPAINTGGRSVASAQTSGALFPAWTASTNGENITLNFGATAFVNAAVFAGLGIFDLWENINDVVVTPSLIKNRVDYELLLTDDMHNNPFWTDAFSSISNMSNPAIHSAIEALAGLRSITVEPYFAGFNMQMLGFKVPVLSFTPDEYQRLMETIGTFVQTRGASIKFIDFIGFIKNVQFTHLPLWASDILDITTLTDTYPVGSEVWNGGIWFPTSFYDVAYDLDKFNIDNTQIEFLFRVLAPIHLVLRQLVGVSRAAAPLLITPYSLDTIHDIGYASR